MHWKGQVRDTVAMAGVDVRDLGPRTLTIILIKSTSGEIQEQLRLRFGKWWGMETMTWDSVTEQLRDILSIDDVTIYQALGELKQSDSTPACEFAQKFDRVVREVGNLP